MTDSTGSTGGGFELLLPEYPARQLDRGVDEVREQADKTAQVVEEQEQAVAVGRG